MKTTTYHTNFFTKMGLLRACNLLLVLLPLLSQPLALKAQTITTVAGNGTQGSSGDGGPATAANLFSPSGVAVDATGGILIADRNNNRIRRVAPDGTITTVAGNGMRDFSGDGGPAIAASLSTPNEVAVDATGGILIADTNNNRIRRVAPDGTITTVAGNGTAGFSGDGGPAISASLFSPYGVAVDATGGILIADTFNNRIRRVAPDGTITTVAGNGVDGFSGDGGPATSASLLSPYGVAVDATGGILIADTFNNRIRRVAPDGTITTVAGNGTAGFSGDGGPAISASLFSPYGVAVDATGGLLIGDQENHRIRRVAPDGTITTVAGGTFGYAGDGGPATAASLRRPTGVTVDATGGILIADTFNNRIRRVAPACAPPTAFAVTGGGAYCAGGSGATVGLAGSQAGVSYQLELNGIGVGSPLTGTGAALSFGPQAAGTYTVVASTAVGGCTADMTGSVTVGVTLLPDAGFSGLSASYCANADAATLTAATPGGTFGGPGVSGSTFTPASAGAGGSITYSVTVNGCTNTSSQNVTVNPLPDASISGNGGAVCSGGDASFTLSGTSGATLTYTITGQNDSQTLVLNGGSQTITASGATNNVSLMLLSVSLDGCSQNLSANSTVTVKPLPTASISGNGGAICAGGDASFTLSGTSGATLNYTITGQNGSQTLGLNGSSQIITASGAASNVTLTLVSVSLNGCIQNLSEGSTVTVKPLPDAGFTGLADPYCADASPVILTPTTPGGTFTGPGVSGSTFTPANAGSGGTILYTVTVEGCSNTSQQSVVVRPAITLNTSPNTSVVYGYGSSCTTLTASASGGTGSLGLTWSTGATGNSVQVCPTQTTAYTVTATDAAGCSVSRQITVTVNDVRCGYGGVKMCLGGREACVAQYLVPTYLRFGYTLGSCNSTPARIGYESHGLEEPLKLSLTAYPNPVKDAVTVQVLSPTAGQGTFKVLDMNGVTRQTRTEQLSEGLNQIELRLGTLPTGVYLIRCVDAAGRQAVARVSKE